MGRKRIAGARPKIVVSNTYFKLLLWINVSLCAITLFTMIALASIVPDALSQHQQVLFNTCEKIFT